jgi:hypothetical protein
LALMKFRKGCPEASPICGEACSASCVQHGIDSTHVARLD